MPTLQLDREYYSITDQMWQWTKVNAPDTEWHQFFGCTTLSFSTEEAMEKFKQWLGKP